MPKLLKNKKNGLRGGCASLMLLDEFLVSNLIYQLFEMTIEVFIIFVVNVGDTHIVGFTFISRIKDKLILLLMAPKFCAG